MHVVWHGNYLQQTKYYVGPLYYTRFDGQKWSTPSDIEMIWADRALRNSLTIDGHGTLHLIYKGVGRLDSASIGEKNSLQVDDVWYTTAPGARADQIAAWRLPYRLNWQTPAYFSDIAIDSRGVIHVIWTEAVNRAWGLYYTYSADGGVTWSARIPLDESDPVWWYRAHLKIDGKDRLHVVWEVRDPTETGADFGVSIAARYAISTDGGQTWDKTTFMNHTGLYPSGLPFGPGPQQPSIGVDGSGTILLVFRQPDSEKIMYEQSKDGLKWSEASPIPGITKGIYRPYDIYDTVTDSAGHVHLAMVGYPTGSSILSLLHSEWNGQSWSSPSVIVASPPYPEYPKLALSNGNQLHIAWFDGDLPTTDRKQIGVWYSTASTTAPRTTGRPSPPSEIAVATNRPSDATASGVSQSDSLATPAVVDPASPWRTDLTNAPMVSIAEAVLPVGILLALLVASRVGPLSYIASRFGRRN